MQFQKKHKIYAALVGAALVAWGIDAMFFESAPSGPPVASAATQADAIGPPAPSAEAKPTPKTDGDSKWLAAQLQVWSAKSTFDLESVRDVFATPVSWAPPKMEAVAPSKSTEKISSDFQRQHHLTAVVLGSSGGSALIDGRLLHIGQSVAGCRLISVSSGCADLSGPDGQTFRIVIGSDDGKSPK
ncbi:MAG TPA: hypothetical protein VIM11_15715 [Tepidisphaeraceae bacterium]|jgi:hypothetical protein